MCFALRLANIKIRKSHIIIANKVISSVANSDWGKQKLKNLANNIYPRGYTDLDGSYHQSKLFLSASVTLRYLVIQPRNFSEV